MASKNPFLDQFARLATDAVAAAQGVGDEARAVFRAQGQRMVADLDLAEREELEVLKDVVREQSAAILALEARLKALEARFEGE